MKLKLELSKTERFIVSTLLSIILTTSITVCGLTLVDRLLSLKIISEGFWLYFSVILVFIQSYISCYAISKTFRK